MGKIVVIGSSNTDLVLRTSKVPLPGETAMANDLTVVQGGKGANQAIAAIRAGADVTFITKTGKDNFGEATRNELIKNGISEKYIFTDETTPSGVAVIWVNENTGQNSILVAPGANAKLSVADIDYCENVIKKADIMLLQLETPVETVHYALKMAKEYGIKTILNPAPATRLSKELLKMVDIITPNESEIEILTGINPNTPENIKIATLTLLELVNEAVILTLGSNGVYYRLKNNSGCFVPAEQVNAIDTTAAGDVFNGFFTAEYVKARNIHNSVLTGNQAAAISVTRKGAQTSIPYYEEIKTVQIV